jgi:hypothetical protein
LASDRLRVHELLAKCPLLLREAFLEALYAVAQQSQALPSSLSGDTRIANRLLADWEAESNPRTMATDVVNLQTLVLMAIETDGHGPASVKGQHGGPAKASILGRAIGLAYSMDLHLTQIDPIPGDDFDADAEDKVALKSWWTLVMLDRWNAIGGAFPTMVPNDTIVVLPGLKPILGESAYTMLRESSFSVHPARTFFNDMLTQVIADLSNILGHFVPMAMSPSKELNPGAGPVIGSWMNLVVESFRLNFPTDMTPTSNPLAHLAYWHCRLLCYLFSPTSLATDILWAAKEIVGLLTRNSQLLSPVNQHFSCLAALALLELSKVDKTREEANKLLKEVLESNIAPSSWDGAVRDKIAERIRPSTSSGIDSQSLQHLADLATATTELSGTNDKVDGPVVYRVSDHYESVGFDPRPLLQAGYLTAFVPPEALQAAS